jgi:cardiolipin synthase
MQRSEPAADFDSARDALSRPVVVAGQHLTLYSESPPLIAAMLTDMRAARSRIWLETYIFADDAAGRAVAAVLAERARAGLDVRLLVDAWGSFSVPSRVWNELRAAGVRVHLFHAFYEAFYAVRFLQVLNQRDHRKLLVIDEQIAYFGGMNIVDQSGIRSRDDARARHLPASAGWRDVHVRMVGPRQAELAAAFSRLWNRVHRRPTGTREPHWPLKEIAAAPGDSLYFFDSRPLLKDRRPHRVLAPLLRQAQSDITMSVAYFIPLGRVLRELVRARKRGVRVRVIVPERGDVRLVQWAARHFYEYLLKRGFRIYERKDRMLHSKVMVIDGRWSMVGSCNLDARSLRLNLEFFAVAHSRPLADALLGICEEEIEHSTRVTAAYCRRRGFWQRLVHRAAWTLRKWL